MKNKETESKEEILEANKMHQLGLLFAFHGLHSANEPVLAEYVKSLMFKGVDNDLAVEVINVINADDECPWMIRYAINTCEECGDEYLIFDIYLADDFDDDDDMPNSCPD